MHFMKSAAACVLTSLLMSNAVFAYSDNGSVIALEDFENYEEGTQLKANARWGISIDSETDSLSIATDPETGSKALKFVKGRSDKNSYAEYSLSSPITSGMLKISYDLHIESATKYMNSVGAVRNSSWSNLIGPRIKNRILSDGDGAAIAMADRTFAKEVRHIENVVNLKTKELIYRVYDGDTLLFEHKKSITQNNVQRIIFSCNEDRNWHVNAWEATYDESGMPSAEDLPNVMYIDNICFERTAFAVTSHNCKDDAEVDGEIKIEFNAEIGEKFGDFIEIYENGNIIDKNGYSFSAENNSAVIKILPSLMYDTEYTVKIKSGAKDAEDLCMPLSEDYEIKFRTKNIIPDVGISEGKRYNGSASANAENTDKITYKAQISYNGSDFADYEWNTVLDEVGDYILKITATENGYSQEKTIAFSIVGLMPPRAENITISQKDRVLTGKYDFADDNGDEEGESLYKWSKNTDGEYKDVGEWQKIPESGIEYTLSDEDIDGYIKLLIKPVSKSEPNDEEYFESEAFALPFKPIIKNGVKLEGEVKVGGKLSAVYEYFDENGDEEDGSIVKWYRVYDNEQKQIENCEEREYILTEEDIDCDYRCVVIPKNTAINGVGAEYTSNTLMGMYAPQISDLKFTGSVTAGKSVGAEYKFSDRNGDKEGNSKFSWFIDGDLVSEDQSYSIPSNAKGTLELKVTPMADNYPYEGKTVSISANIATGSSGSGCRGGSGGGSGISYTPGGGSVNTGMNTMPEKTEDTKPDETKSEFGDIKNHWAKDYIQKLYDMGIVKGDTENNFNPDKKITRAEVAALAERMLGLDAEYVYIFDDVAADKWYAKSVAAVNSAKIMVGDGKTFRPNDYITREELCGFAVKVLRYKNIEQKNAQSNFADNDEISAWAKQAVGECFARGIVNGVGENRFSPKTNATRAETAVIITKLLAETADAQ